MQWAKCSRICAAESESVIVAPSVLSALLWGGSAVKLRGLSTAGFPMLRRRRVIGPAERALILGQKFFEACRPALYGAADCPGFESE
jgi:hypothetical protein